MCFEHPGLLADGRRRATRRGVHHLLRRGPAWPRSSTVDADGRPRCARPTGASTVDITPGRRRRARRPGARPRRHRHRRPRRRVGARSSAAVRAAPTSSIPSSRATSATPARCSPTWPASARRQGAASRPCCASDARRLVPTSSRRAAAAMAAPLRAAGGRLFTFGNGGSATDAAGSAPLVRRAAVAARRSRPGRLADDQAVLTALGNDVGFELVFSRQLDRPRPRRATSRSACSTSGDSAQRAPAPSTRRAAAGMLTVGLAGYDGGEMAASADVDHCLVVRSDSVHRIQEAQAALAFATLVGGPGAPRRATAGAVTAPHGRHREPRRRRSLDRIEAFRRRRPRLHRRRRHPRPRRRRQGVGRAARRRCSSTAFAQRRARRR